MIKLVWQILCVFLVFPCRITFTDCLPPDVSLESLFITSLMTMFAIDDSLCSLSFLIFFTM